MRSERFSVQLKDNGDIHVDVSPDVVRTFCLLANEFTREMDVCVETADIMIAFILAINAKELTFSESDESEGLSITDRETLIDWVRQVVQDLKSESEVE